MNYKHIIDAVQNVQTKLNWEYIYSGETWA